MRRKFVLFLTVLVTAAATALMGGCRVPPPNQEEMGAHNYGPQPDNYEQIIRDYLKPKLADPDGAVIEFRAGPKLLYQQATQLRPLEYGWGVCALVNEKKPSGGFAGFYPMVFFIRDGKIVAVNGGNGDNVIGWRFARTGCHELGFDVP